MPPDAAFAQELAALRDKYRAHLHTLLAFVDQARQDAAAGSLNAQDAKQLMVTAHKCAGTAAAYGFDAVSDAGRALDYYLLDHPQPEPVAASGVIDAFQTALREAVDLD